MRGMPSLKALVIFCCRDEEPYSLCFSYHIPCMKEWLTLCCYGCIKRLVRVRVCNSAKVINLIVQSYKGQVGDFICLETNSPTPLYIRMYLGYGAWYLVVSWCQNMLIAKNEDANTSFMEPTWCVVLGLVPLVSSKERRISSLPSLPPRPYLNVFHCG